MYVESQFKRRIVSHPWKRIRALTYQVYPTVTGQLTGYDAPFDKISIFELLITLGFAR